MTVMLLYCPVLIIQILVTLHTGNVQHLAKKLIWHPCPFRLLFAVYNYLLITLEGQLQNVLAKILYGKSSRLIQLS